MKNFQKIMQNEKENKFDSIIQELLDLKIEQYETLKLLEKEKEK